MAKESIPSRVNLLWLISVFSKQTTFSKGHWKLWNVAARQDLAIDTLIPLIFHRKESNPVASGTSRMKEIDSFLCHLSSKKSIITSFFISWGKIGKAKISLWESEKASVSLARGQASLLALYGKAPTGDSHSRNKLRRDGCSEGWRAGKGKSCLSR